MTGQHAAHLLASREPIATWLVYASSVPRASAWALRAATSAPRSGGCDPCTAALRAANTTSTALSSAFGACPGNAGPSASPLKAAKHGAFQQNVLVAGGQQAHVSHRMEVLRKWRERRGVIPMHRRGPDPATCALCAFGVAEGCHPGAQEGKCSSSPCQLLGRRCENSLPCQSALQQATAWLVVEQSWQNPAALPAGVPRDAVSTAPDPSNSNRRAVMAYSQNKSEVCLLLACSVPWSELEVEAEGCQR